MFDEQFEMYPINEHSDCLDYANSPARCVECEIIASIVLNLTSYCASVVA